MFQTPSYEIFKKKINQCFNDFHLGIKGKVDFQLWYKETFLDKRFPKFSPIELVRGSWWHQEVLHSFKSKYWSQEFEICYLTFYSNIVKFREGRAGESASLWHRRWDESRSRAVYAKLESNTIANSEPERARVCQRVALRASESQSGSHRESQRARERLASHF